MTIYKYLNVTSESTTMQKSEDPSNKFLTTAKFSEAIELMVKESNGLLNYIDAVVCYCEENEIELESVNKLLSKPLKERIRHDACKLNYIKQSSKGILPL